MAEHLIRLRGGWTDPAGAARLSLPVVWGRAAGPPRRLVRPFGRPRVDPAAESVALRLAGLPGLVGLALDGVELPIPDDPTPPWTVSIELPPGGRSTLVLDVDPGRLSAEQADRPWGEVALVIAPR